MHLTTTTTPRPSDLDRARDRCLYSPAERRAAASRVRKARSRAMQVAAGNIHAKAAESLLVAASRAAHWMVDHGPGGEGADCNAWELTAATLGRAGY